MNPRAMPSCKRSIYRTVISLTCCPVAVVPAPPAVTVTAPADVIVPARSPAVPAVVLITLEKLGTAPTVGAAVGQHHLRCRTD